MAYKKRVVEKPKTKTGSKGKARAKKKTGAERDEDAPAGEFTLEQLRCDVQQELGEHSKKIAEVMRKKLLSGNFSFAKMMLEIVKPDRAGKGTGRSRRGPSLAQALAKERRWMGALPGEEIHYYDGSPETNSKVKAAAS